MSCAQTAVSKTAAQPLLRLRARPLRIALVGNPNVGKSVLFGRLTGQYAIVSNYPGTTVAVTNGRALIGAEVCDLIDTPGVNALEGAVSEDEMVTRRIVAGDGVDVVVQVVDASNLRRGLMLTSQLALYGKPLVLALNMVDEARSHGIDVDSEALARRLGVPVIETVATEGRGVAALRRVLPDAVVPSTGFEPGRDHAAWGHALASEFRRQRPRAGRRVQERLSRLVREPLTGLPILAVVLYLMYLAVGVFGAQTLVGLIETHVFQAFINPGAVAFFDRFVPVAFVRDLFVGEYGLITMGLTYAVAIVLPVVATFFFVFGFLEDSGYIPRLAIFSDRIFRAMGLNGKAVLPMVLGLGCDTMATMTTRILGTPKERLIAVLLLALGIPCSAQLATILGILGGISFAAVVTLFAVVLGQMFLVGFLAARALPGERSEFILELPPIRWPHMRNVVYKTGLRVRWYLGEAVPLFLVGTVILFGLSRLGWLAVLIRSAEPLVVGLLGLPAKTAQVLIMGFLRRDYGAAGLFAMARSGQLSGAQAVVALTVMTLFVPCVANFLMMIKEQGSRAAFAILGVVTVIAIGTGAGLNAALRVLHVTF
ncbi:MAG: ferrous iron transporter B [Acidobacteria bacterium]|nr:ferrous iron transporter B [Acidobacteriota bacterium]